ncbi:hypothetical protein EVAR_64961_1 [Eumeta japonica]|uniref:Uncharacterized protein n=1 Tax=Eumeta variegata TaxID=151549 RepID=A0A4C1ZPG4_EUMVA|nr:hypothetical protein EVAR_64961_1 [Eumeta japonica]
MTLVLTQLISGALLESRSLLVSQGTSPDRCCPPPTRAKHSGWELRLLIGCQNRWLLVSRPELHLAAPTDRVSEKPSVCDSPTPCTWSVLPSSGLLLGETRLLRARRYFRPRSPCEVKAEGSAHRAVSDS